MLFVKISALSGKSLKVDEIMGAMESDLYDDDKKILPKGSSTFLWQTLDCITHTPKSTGKQESLFELDSKKDEFPIFVDLYLTTVFKYDEIAKIMRSITSILSAKTKIDKKNIFIHTHIGSPGHVYILDEVWPRDCVIDNPKPEEDSQ